MKFKFQTHFSFLFYISNINQRGGSSFRKLKLDPYTSRWMEEGEKNKRKKKEERRKKSKML